MSVEDGPLSPVPQHTKPVSEDSGNKGYFNTTWTRWLLELRAKINVINGLLVNFSNLAGTGFPVLTPSGEFNIVTLQPGIGINITNGDGQAGDPLIETKAQFIMSKDDFPAPVAGVISLPNNTTYFLLNNVDLLGDRLNCGNNIAILGGTSDSCGLFSTGLVGDFFTSTSSLDLRNISLSAPTGRLFNLNDGVGASLGWQGLRIFDTPNFGTIQNYANVVIDLSIITNTANCILDGTIASFVSETSLWDGRPGQTTITVPATAVITRRFRMLYTAMTALPGETAIDFNVGATVPDEGYILDNVNFSGGGTYLAGVDYTSNKAAFFRNVGITNSSALCQYSMTGNTTATAIGVVGTFVKIAGTTVPSGLNQKFDTTTTNRAEYEGVTQDNFRAVVFASMTSGNNQDLRMRVAKNGVDIPESTAKFRTTGSGEASSIGCQTFVDMVPGDYVEAWVTNDTATTAIVVTDINVTVTRLN